MSKNKAKSRFSGAVSSNAVKQKERSNFGYLNLPEGISIFKIDSGKSMFFDILPYEVTDKNHPDRKSIEQTDGLWYRRPFMVHSIPNGEFTDKVVCPSSFGKPCPICEYVKQMKNNGATFEEMKPFKAKERNLYVVIPHGHKEMEEKPYIWDDTQWYFQKMLNDELAENSENECFPDLENGLMLKVRFSDDLYNKKPAPKPTRIDFMDREENGGRQYTEKILKKIPNLDEVLIVLSYKELEMKLNGIGDADLDEPKEDEKLVKKSKWDTDDDDDTPVRKKKTIAPVEDDDEEEEKPVKKSTRKKAEPAPKKKVEVEEEEDDEDEDDKIQVKDRCIACQGTGKNSRGKTCPICNGTGRKPAEKAEKVDPMKNEIRKGTKVNSPKYGECTVIAIDEDDNSLTIEDEDGDEHENIPAHKVTVISFGKPEKKKEEKPVKKEEKNRCPFKHVFGKDCDEFKECSDCDNWDACNDAG